MEFLINVPDITVVSREDENLSFTIETVQYYDENESRIILRCAEYIPHFKRGFTCDFQLTIDIINENSDSLENKYKDKIEDLVLVYVNRCVDNASMWQYEYVFYK